LASANPDAGAHQLAALSFESVHTALASNTLGDAWKWLEDRLPTLSFLRNWDKCERLRHGLVEWFVRFDWPAASFVACATDDETLRLLLKACGKVDRGETLLKRIRKAADGGMKLNWKQLELIASYT
jgi:hypothetical protein